MNGRDMRNMAGQLDLSRVHRDNGVRGSNRDTKEPLVLKGRDKWDKPGQRGLSQLATGGTGGTPPKGGVPPVPSHSVPARIERLASRVDRLRPSHRDPEHFHVEKSEIVRAMLDLAEEAELR